MKTVLYLDHTPFVGGTQLVLVSHFKHLDKSKFAPIVGVSKTALYTGNPPLAQRYSEAGARVVVLPFAKLKTLNPFVFVRFFDSLFSVKKIIKKYKVDLIVTNTERAMYVGSLAGILTRNPVVWWVRDFCYNKLLFKFLQFIPAHIIFVSKSIRNFYLQKTTHSGDSVVYVGSDFDEKLQQVSLEEVENLRQQWGVDKNTTVVGFVGRLVDWKGGMVLLEAVRYFQSLAPNVKTKFVIVGSGKDQEGGIEEKMLCFIKENSLENVVIMAGFREDIPICLKAFDIFVHPVTQPEPFATTVVEAMLAGLPVVGVTIGGDVEILREGDTGFLVPPNDPNALAEKLKELVQNADLCVRAAKTGQKYALEHNTERITTNQVESILNDQTT